MSSLKSLYLAMIVTLIFFAGCQTFDNIGDNMDDATKPSMKTDDNGVVINRPEGKTLEEREEIAISNKKIDIIQGADVKVVDDKKAVYVTNSENKFCGILFNPHPDLSQDAVVKYDGEVIFTGTIKPKHMKRIFSFHIKDEDKICVQWTMGKYKAAVDSPFPEGPAIIESPMGDPCHFRSHGFGIDGYTPDIYTWQE